MERRWRNCRHAAQGASAIFSGPQWLQILIEGRMSRANRECRRRDGSEKRWGGDGSRGSMHKCRTNAGAEGGERAVAKFEPVRRAASEKAPSSHHFHEAQTSSTITRLSEFRVAGSDGVEPEVVASMAIACSLL